MSAPAGYTFGQAPRSPVSVEELDRLKKTLLFTEEDVAALRMSREVLADQVDAILDVWYGFIGSLPFLLRAFTSTQEGKPDTRYLAAVRERFGRWILDTAEAHYDQRWLDYQHEIAIRHTPAAKNRTDGVDAVDNVEFRYLLATVYPITYTLKPFLAKKGHSAQDVERMHQAWIKSVLLQVTLWSRAYIREGLY